jgi:site-specific DNA recombinase
MRTAAYARYSTDMQRESSIEDQLRNVRARCAREGWPAPMVYSDAAISGARSDRPGFRALLADATARKLDVLLVDDLSRLSRDKDDTGKAIKRLTFAGVRVIGVSDGTDTSRDGYELDTGIRAVIGEHYLRDLAKKTHRGLTGRALSGACAGGLPYGYRVTAVGQRAIDADQATVVRRIFADYVAGLSPRAIAGMLNHEGVRAARGDTWCLSAIHGDRKRGIGILANPIYAGRQIWNRSRWVKHPDTGRRLRQERPESDWIITDHPELAIIDAATWNAAQARQRRNAGAAPGRAPWSPTQRHTTLPRMRRTDDRRRRVPLRLRAAQGSRRVRLLERP